MTDQETVITALFNLNSGLINEHFYVCASY